MPASNWMPVRHWLIILLPVAAVGAAAAVAFAAIDRMTQEVNANRSAFNERTVTAAVNSLVRRMGETHGEYAVWDDAVKNLYGEVDPEFVEVNYSSSSEAGTFFDTVFLLDEAGEPVFAYHDGETVSDHPRNVFGASFESLLLQAPRKAEEPPAAGLILSPWGIQVIAVGPVLPNTGNVDPPTHWRQLVVARTLDDTLIERLRLDYLINDLRLARLPEMASFSLLDPQGNAIGWLAWRPATAGTIARKEVDYEMLLTFGLVAVGILGLSLLAVVSLRRGEKLADGLVAKQERLENAFAAVPSGLCMFDAQKRLLMCNQRYAEMYNLPSRLTKAGTTLHEIFEYRKSIGNAPADFPNYVSHVGIDWTTGGTKVFEFPLVDGRVIRVSHLNLDGGSYIATHEDITAAVHAERRLAESSTLDALTGLPNRTAFRDALDAKIAGKESLAVLAIDLDHFKDLNEGLHHSKGDRVLRLVAERLRSVIGETDLLGRIGGDGYGIVQTGCKQPEGSRRLAARISEALAKPFALDDAEVRLTASIGIALLASHGGTAGDLIRNAEMALFWMKGHGRNGYQFYDPAMGAEAQTHHKILAALRAALENDEFDIHYQPFINLSTGAITGYEALLRWDHPELGVIPPGTFIPIAEEAGLIVPIGRWILRKACAEAVKWPHPRYVAVNLSSAQFQDDELSTTVFNALSASGLSASRLELEVTETVLLANESRVRSKLHQLRQAGIRIAMDDFGTGYSSLSYLRSFPFDKIKIDQSFIRDLPQSHEAAAIVRAVIGLGTEFGRSVVGEGVETAEQSGFLLAVGCQEAQGFYFGEPRPLSATLAVIKNRAA